MIPYKNQMAMPWQTQALLDFPLFSGMCAWLCHIGVVLLDTFDSSVLRAQTFYTNEVAADKECIIIEQSRGISPIQKSGNRQSCTRTTSIAHRLRQLCDQFELEFEGQGLFHGAAKSDTEDWVKCIHIISILSV
ncbi:hypothetical protein OSTOST_23268, partial [Ostertagia ostertagi]